MIVLCDQKELSGPSQHCTILIYVCYDSPDDSGVIAQLYIDQKRDTTICCVYFPILQHALLVCGNQSVDALSGAQGC